jgi:hypothetical protein
MSRANKLFAVSIVLFVLECVFTSFFGVIFIAVFGIPYCIVLSQRKKHLKANPNEPAVHPARPVMNSLGMLTILFSATRFSSTWYDNFGEGSYFLVTLIFFCVGLSLTILSYFLSPKPDRSPKYEPNSHAVVAYSRSQRKTLRVLLIALAVLLVAYAIVLILFK